MADLTADAMAAKLAAAPFERSDPPVAVLTDPIADTPMIVTLDELRPYNLNPRVTRNPLYEDIKASIRARGLDAPPAITRRPGDPHYLIRNGGNTRLAILGELWAETRDERFFRIACLFRPWSARGEIVVLTGHLAENELHGELTFIERALAVEKARELYEQESGAPLTQTELAQRLTADGYPITQPHISRMQDAVRHLLPAIPSLLYAGLGRPQIERLAALRKGAERAWEHHAAQKSPSVHFPLLWQEVLASFEASPADFSAERAQDELVGQMAQLLSIDYDALALEIVDVEAGQRASSRELVLLNAADSTARAALADADETSTARFTARAADRFKGAGATGQRGTRLDGHIVSPAQSTERLQAIERTIAAATGESSPDFERNVLRAIPVQAGSLYPISDVWYIEPSLDSPERLRAHIAQFAREIAHEAGITHCIESLDEGIGFTCVKPPASKSPPSGFFPRAVLSLLGALSVETPTRPRATSEEVRLAEDLAPLLFGPASARQPAPHPLRLSDAGLVKLFRLIRLARRLIDWQSGCAGARR